jgi:shikimate kinase
MKKDSIALIGFMATGKSVVGRALVKELDDNFEFLETDDLVVKLAGKSIPKIFSENGEVVFRHYEIEACRIASKQNKVVISCGGGVILNPINIDNLRKNCYIVLLNAPTEEIYKRIMKDGKQTRPMIDTTEPLNEIKTILAYRQPLYDSAADIVIDTTKKSLNEIVSMILTKINEIN